MKNHFDLPINYKDKVVVVVKVQCLSNNLPEIIYVIWPKDEELIQYFNNVKQFYFHINSKLDAKNLLKINHYVVYDYKNTENIITDTEFELAIWDALFTLNL